MPSIDLELKELIIKCQMQDEMIQKLKEDNVRLEKENNRLATDSKVSSFIKFQ